MRDPQRVRVVMGALAGLLLLAGMAGSPPALAQPNVTGQWSTLPYPVPINPIHVALLPSGNVLIVAGSENDPSQTIFKYAVWDPSAGTFNQYTTPWDLFCNGMSYLPDGRLILTGGNLTYENTSVTPPTPFTGLSIATIFDPATEKFIQLENMAHGRWYPTNTFLGDGTMTFSGLDEHGVMNQTSEIYDVGSGWSGPYPANFPTKWYPRMHLLGNGKVINTGPDPPTRAFDPSAGTWSGVVATTNYSGSRVYGSSVLLPLRPDDGYAHRIVIFGGNTAGATNTVEQIDTSVSLESWTSLPPMQYPRTTMNAVLLPDGKIVAVGGSQTFNDATTAALNAEMFDPVSATWSPAGAQVYPRMYHSVALLLPDGTVWSAGSNPAEGVWEPHMEIYQPPYLFTSTGAPAPRPAITSLPSVVGYGQTFTIGTPHAASIKDVVLMRPGSNTHAFDMEARMLYTAFTKSSDTLTVTAPTNGFAAPAGYYMVFLLDTNGVPSVAKFLRLAKNPTNQPPTATIANPTTSSVSIQAGESVTFAGTATDSDGSIAVYQWIFPGGSPGMSNVPTPGAVTFPNPGTYIVSLTVLDNLGDNNVSPPTVTVDVAPTTALTASITSPPNGATVSNTVTVNMSAGNAQGSSTQFVLKLDNTTTLSTQSVPSSSTTTYAWNTSTVPNGAHTLDLTVTDGAGQTASTSISVTVSTGGGTGPTIGITSPFNGDWIGNSVEVKATASSTLGLATLKFWGNGGVFATANCSGTSCAGAVWWITGSLPPAAYQIQVVATDTAGESTVSAPVTVNKDAASPVVPSGAGGGTPPPALTASITSPANGTTVNNTVAVNMSAGNAQGSPTQFVLKLDNTTTLSIQSVATGSTATYAWNTSTVPNGAHTLDLTVSDGAGRPASAGVSVTVSNGAGGGSDTTPPNAAITSPPTGAWTGNSIDVHVNGTDNVALANIKVYGNGTFVDQVTCGGPSCSGVVWWLTGSLPSGRHTITAVATDTSGNQTTTPPVTINK